MCVGKDVYNLWCWSLPSRVFTNTIINYNLHFADNNPKLCFTVRHGYGGDRLPHLNEGPLRANRWSSPFMKVKAGDGWKPEARCDSPIDSHRRRSRATWVRLWNVAPLSAGVLWALRHSPTMCPSTPQGRAGSPFPRAWMQLPGYSDDILPPQLKSCCPSC